MLVYFIFFFFLIQYFFFKSQDWNKETKIEVKAVVEPVSGKGSRSMILQLYADQQTWKPALSNLALPPVQVNKSVCYTDCKSCYKAQNLSFELV